MPPLKPDARSQGSRAGGRQNECKPKVLLRLEGHMHTNMHTHVPAADTTPKGTGPSEVQGLQGTFWARDRRAVS